MIAVDTNILVYAHDPNNPWNAPAAAAVASLAEGSDQWAIPWPCLHEFLAVVTNRRINERPGRIDEAISQVEAWIESPTLLLLSEGHSTWPVLRSLIEDGQIEGGMVHDARIAALCRYHGVTELWTADRDFARFTGLRVRNPLV